MCKFAQGLSLCFFAKVDQCHVLDKNPLCQKRLAFKYARGHGYSQNYDHNHAYLVISTDIGSFLRDKEIQAMNFFVFHYKP